MKKIIYLINWLSLLSFSYAGTPNGEEILRLSDQYRGLKQEFSLITEVKYYKNNLLKSEAKVKSYVKNDRRSISRVLEPDSMKGTVILSTDENMWIYIPKTRNPIRIPPQQRFVGQASNGDIARMTYAGDYNVKVNAGQKIEEKDCYFLELTAKRSETPYDRIDYYVEKTTYRPVKSVFYAKTGRVLKESYYTSFKKFPNGSYGVSQQLFIDKIRENEKTTMDYDSPQQESLPDAYFQKNFMERLK